MDATTQPTNLVDQLIRTAIETVLRDDSVQKLLAESLKLDMHNAITSRLGELELDADRIDGLEAMIETEVEREVEREVDRAVETAVSEAVDEAVSKAVDAAVEMAVSEAVEEKTKEIEEQIENLINEKFQNLVERLRITID